MNCRNKETAWLEIDLSKIEHNVKEVSRLIPATSKIMGIVKDNAYGHGDVEVAQAMEANGVDFFGVSSMEEAVRLRKAGISANILILAYSPIAQVEQLKTYNIIQTIVSLEHAIALDTWAKQHQTKLSCHLKVDTGMGRVGVRYVEGDKRVDEILAIYQLEHLHVEGVFSHFSVSDDLAEENIAYTRNQIVLYEEVLAMLAAHQIPKQITHLQNSYGILNYPELSYDYVRPGLLHLGLTSDIDIPIQHPVNFQPIMEGKAMVTMVKEVRAGSSISYGRNFIAPDTMQVATLGIGYGDGYPRSMSNKGAHVLLHGVYCEVIGNICMDQILIDARGVKVQVEDVVTLFGQEGTHSLPIDQIAQKANTINNDILCMLNTRLPRYYK
ncbi:MAG: alanine racemase [Erysipelotrichaceae bacterium]